MNLANLTDRLREALAVNPAAQGAFKFVIGGLGVIRVDGQGVSNDDEPAQCVMTMTAGDLEAMLAGRLDPQLALADGRLELDGDVAVAQAMQPALAAAWLSR